MLEKNIAYPSLFSNVRYTVKFPSLLFILFMVVTSISSISSDVAFIQNSIECLKYGQICNEYEFCFEGQCLPSDPSKNSIQSSRDVKRLEKVPYINYDQNPDAPIRIHKYDVDSGSDSYSDDDFVDYVDTQNQYNDQFNYELTNDEKPLISDRSSNEFIVLEPENYQDKFPDALEYSQNELDDLDDLNYLSDLNVKFVQNNQESNDFEDESINNDLNSVVDRYDKNGPIFNELNSFGSIDEKKIEFLEDTLLEELLKSETVRNRRDIDTVGDDLDLISYELEKIETHEKEIIEDEIEELITLVKEIDHKIEFINDIENLGNEAEQEGSIQDARYDRDYVKSGYFDADNVQNDYNKPLVYENSGVDENGNSFYERETIQTNIEPFDHTQVLPIESNDEDYFYVEEPFQRNNQEIKILNGLFNTPDEMIESEKNIIDIPKNQFNDRYQNWKNILGLDSWNSRVHPNLKQNHIFRNDIAGIDMPFKIEHKKDLEVTPRKSKIDSWGLNEATSKRFNFLKKDSAINFELPKFQKLPSLQDFKIQHEQDNLIQQLKRNESKLQVLTELEQRGEKALENKLDDIDENSEDHQKKISVQADQLIKFEKNVVTKENEFLSEAFEQKSKLSSEDQVIDPSYIYIQLNKKITQSQAQDLLDFVSRIAGFPSDFISDVSITENLVIFKAKNVNLDMLCSIIKDNEKLVFAQRGFRILSCNRGSVKIKHHRAHRDRRFLFISAIVAFFVVICALLFLIGLFILRRRTYLRRKLIDSVGAIPKKKKFDDVEQLVNDDESKPSLINRVWPFKTNQLNTQQSDLCRSNKVNSTISPMNNTQSTNLSNRNENFESTPITVDERKESNRNSASSWSEEPISNINMDITTGHAILSYMDRHLNDKNRLDKDWDDLCNYEADRSEVFVGMNEENMAKNRYSNILPYDHNRVKLGSKKENKNDYINASLITDDDPKNPAYIATQGPLSHTTSDFWQMIWEQNSIIIVSLCRTIEYGSSKCTQYWPTNGFEVYDGFEVHLVSEHVWCEEYLVRSFYLKNKSTNQTRTVTQFQYLTWPENNLPPNIKSVLEFRRKINKSYNRKSFPIVVHCNDGIGRTGTFIMIDMILNKITKEAKEIDLAATLEYLRDQRKDMIKTKSQFEYSFAVITEEVQNMLKTLIH